VATATGEPAAQEGASAPENRRRRAAKALSPRRFWASPRILLIRQLPRASKPLTALAGVSLAIGAALPTAQMLVAGTLVGRVPAALKAGGLDTPPGRSLLNALAAVAGLYLFQFAAVPLLNLATQALGRRVDRNLSQRVMASVLAPTGIGHLEDPTTLDDVNKAEGLVTGRTPGGAVTAMTAVWAQRLAAIGGAAVLTRFSPLVAVTVVGAALFERRFWRRRYEQVTASLFNRGDLHRRTSYLRDTTLTPIAAKEVRVFDAQAWLQRRFHSAWVEVMAPVWKDIKGRPRDQFTYAVLPTAITLGSLYWIGSSAIDGRIGLAAAVVYAQAVFTANALANAGDQDEIIAAGVAALPVALDLERRLQPDAVGGIDPAAMPQGSIRFEGVHFTYPGRENDIYAGLDLDIPAGRSLAVVGDNGAGKTTLIKLLARLYEPTAGRITVDGVDLRQLDPAKWQTRIAAIFQDFRKYHLPARDNVAFGAPHIASDDAALDRAARRTGADTIVDGLAEGWDTPLDRQLTGGTDLSGGQWQRIALARAMFAVEGGAGVLVLDEPTASLDVRTEAEIYDRFLELTAGLTTIVISHRFSTVRRADVIVVLDGGRVVERGSHDELVALGGRYAEMFNLQASRYADDDVGEVAHG
jgi:ATP-binding cassette subfamily B protein